MTVRNVRDDLVAIGKDRFRDLRGRIEIVIAAISGMVRLKALKA